MEVTLQKGFTLTEMAVSVAVLSVLASISIPGYNMYIARQQAAESVVLMDTVKSKTLQNIIKTGKCTEVGTTETLSGKYGNLVVSGTASKTALIDNQVLQKTGCIYTYTLKADAHRFISGETIVADLFNNGALSKSALTTVDNRYMPKSLVTLVEGVKSTINDDTPVTTPTTTVVQLVQETNPTTPTNPTTNPTPTIPDSTNPTTNPTPTIPDSTNPTNPTNPTTPTKPTPITGEDVNTVVPTTSLIIDRHYMGNLLFLESYHNKPSVNLYDFFVSKIGRAPSANEKAVITVDHDVAVLGKTDPTERFNMAPAGIVIDSRWGSKNTVQLINLGLVTGYGGRQINARCSYCHIELDFMNYGAAKDGGPAIQNLSTARVEIINKGIIAGGGGAGMNRHGERIRQYGQPGTPTLTGLLIYSHPDIMYETRCNVGRGATKPCTLERENWGDRSGVLGQNGYSHIGRIDLVGLAGHITVGNPVIFLERGDLRGR